MFESTTVLILLALLCVIVLIILSISTMMFIKTFRNNTTEDLEKISGAVKELSDKMVRTDGDSSGKTEDIPQNTDAEFSKSVNGLEQYDGENSEKGQLTLEDLIPTKENKPIANSFRAKDETLAIPTPDLADVSKVSSNNFSSNDNRRNSIVLEKNPQDFWRNFERENEIFGNPKEESGFVQQPIEQSHTSLNREPVTLDQAAKSTDAYRPWQQPKEEPSNFEQTLSNSIGEVDELERQLQEATRKMQEMAINAIGTEAVTGYSQELTSGKTGSLQREARIFTDRNSNVDKLGRVYSVEELKNQIR